MKQLKIFHSTILIEARNSLSDVRDSSEPPQTATQLGAFKIQIYWTWINLVWVHHLPPTVIYWYIDLEYDFVSLSVFFLCTCTLTVKRQEIQVSSTIYTFHYSNSTCSVMIDQHCAGNERPYLIGCLHEE